MAERQQSPHYLGATIGRYAIRIARGRFRLDGDADVQVQTNDRGNSLHGGPQGFDTCVWTVESASPSHAELSLFNADGHMGFPGNLHARVRYEAKVDSAGCGTLQIEMCARTDAPTLINMTNHSYFNLEGEGRSVDDHLLSIPADFFTSVDESGIPLGDHQAVVDTPFDLRSPKRVGDIVRTPHPQIAGAGGLDHNFVVAGAGLRRVATLESALTATVLEICSDQPGLQVYSGNSFTGSRRSTGGALIQQGDGIALEPQKFPDSPNKPHWPTAVLLPGEEYRSTILWTFGPTRGAERDCTMTQLR